MMPIRNISQARFKVIVEDTFDRLYASLFMLCKDKQLCEDIMQETYIRLWKNIDNVKDDHAIIALLKCYARNIFLDEMRKSARKQTALSLDEVEPVAAAPDHYMENRELHTEIQTAINKLPRQQQIIFRLAKEHAMSYKQISAEMKIGTGTIEVQMNRALKSLKNNLAHLQERHEEV